MIRSVLFDLWISVKKNAASVLLYSVIFILANYFIVLFLLMSILPMVQMTGNTDTIATLLPVLTYIISYVMTLVLVFILLKKFPLRLPKVIFILPCGKKEKFRYILLQVVIKIIVVLGILFLSRYIFARRILIGNGIYNWLTELCIVVFTFINISLRVGTGEKGAKILDENNYVVLTREEEIVNSYWFSMLILENIIFYSMAFMDRPMSLGVFVIWMVVQAANLFILFKCFKGIIYKAFSFEALYRQQPVVEEL